MSIISVTYGGQKKTRVAVMEKAERGATTVCGCVHTHQLDFEAGGGGGSFSSKWRVMIIQNRCWHTVAPCSSNKRWKFNGVYLLNILAAQTLSINHWTLCWVIHGTSVIRGCRLDNIWLWSTHWAWGECDWVKCTVSHILKADRQVEHTWWFWGNILF